MAFNAFKTSASPRVETLVLAEKLMMPPLALERSISSWSIRNGPNLFSGASS